MGQYHWPGHCATNGHNKAKGGKPATAHRLSSLASLRIQVWSSKAERGRIILVLEISESWRMKSKNEVSCGRRNSSSKLVHEKDSQNYDLRSNLTVFHKLKASSVVRRKLQGPCYEVIRTWMRYKTQVPFICALSCCGQEIKSENSVPVV